MGRPEDFLALLMLCVDLGIRPVIDSTYGFTAVADAFGRLHSGDVFGKVVIDHDH
jgi:D-arabinose 1-dehydrogenase-like Zn-dependent alcohol dehydrogenase